MSHILVAYASSHGQTRAIADHVAARLRTRGHQVVLADAGVERPPPPADFDAVVLGARIQFGRHARPVVDYAQRFRGALATRPCGFFSVSMSAAQAGAGADPNGYLARLFGELDWRPQIVRAIGGGLRYRAYNPILRFVMKQLARRGGHSTDTSRDHVYTDWIAVDAFTDDVAHLIEGQPHRAAG